MRTNTIIVTMLEKLKIDKKIRKELESAKETYSNMPTTWMGNEAMGRILYLMQDPLAAQYLEKAIEYRLLLLKKRQQVGTEQIIVGNYYRMLGDSELAEKYFVEAYEILKENVGDMLKPRELDYMQMQHLIKVCFLLKRYDEVIAYGNLYRKEEQDPMLMANDLTRLAIARVTEDKEAINEWLDETSGRVQSIAGKGHFSSTGDVGGLDFYELVLQMLTEMEEENA